MLHAIETNITRSNHKTENRKSILAYDLFANIFFCIIADAWNEKLLCL